MCVINNCDKGYCLHFSMAVRERVALFIFIVLHLLINSLYCLPRNLSRTPKLENKIKKSINFNLTEPGVKSMLKTNLKNANIQTRTMNNAKEENLCEKFNFPEIEYPTASEPNTPFHFREGAKNLKQKSISPMVNSNKNSIQSPYPIPYSSKVNRNRNTAKKKNHLLRQGPENKTMAEFSSAPNYRDMGMFVELEYPQKAKDMWRPNYWNCPPKVIKSTGESKTNADYITSNKASLQSSLHPFIAQENTNTVDKLNSFPSRKVSNQATFKNQFEVTSNDFQKKESHSLNKIMPEITINSENVYTATPLPSIQKEDLIKTALYAKIYSNIANKAISSIKNILKSEKSNSTNDHYGLPNMKESDVLEDILRFSESNFDDYNFYSLFHNNYYATTPRMPREFSYSSEIPDNVTQSWINVFTAFTEKPDKLNDFQDTISTKNLSDSNNINHSQSIIIDTTSSSHLRDVITTKPSAATLSPRAFIYDDRKLIYDKNNASILGQCNECDFSALDKISVTPSNNDTDSNTTHIGRMDKNSSNNEHDSSLKLDDDYTTDVYPEIKENQSFVLSTVAPFNVSVDDPSWANSEVIDPYKSISYPDELEEYYIAVG